MILQRTTLLSASAFFLLTLASPSYSCVGRIVKLSINDSKEHAIIGQVLSIYINERTGSTVELIQAEKGKPGHCATDVCIHYLNDGLAGMSSPVSAADEQERYNLVKQYYIQNHNLVWLRPLGYKGANAGEASSAVPVAKRESLSKFPVLDRVINRLGGVLDNAAVEELMQQSTGGNPESVAKDWLKQRNLI
jgi:glycine betaine/choline ABC-type transport system substrate-binding protein